MKKSTIYLIVGSLALVVVMLGLGAHPSGGGKATLAGESPEWVRGNPDAKVFLVEYLDFQCPACRAYSGIVKQLLADFPNDLKVGYLHFPLTSIHQNALPSAVAVEAAGTQGKFWEMSDLLFDNQSSWAAIEASEETFGFYAKQLGLDVSKFKTDLHSPDLKAKVMAQQSAGLKMGLAGTPTFYLNGKKIENPRDYYAFKGLIEKELNK